MKNFRLLRADEIECRVSTAKKNGVSLLLYKDARCDMNILDETVGMFGWQRSHELIDGQLFCNVGIYEAATKTWIWKQDVGVESYTEKEKGRASDAFKRACFNWGIGRELYSAPFIWVKSDIADIQPKGDGYTCYDKFYVNKIEYAEDETICGLEIYKDGGYRSDVLAYAYKADKYVDVRMDKIDATKVNALRKELKKRGIEEGYILDSFKINSLTDMTEKQHLVTIGALDTLKEKSDVWKAKVG